MIERSIGTGGLLNILIFFMEGMIDYRRLVDFGDVVNL